MKLFDEEQEGVSKGAQPAFKINEKFAKTFEHNKRREFLEQGKEKFGANGSD
jgi:hypothetical protein